MNASQTGRERTTTPADVLRAPQAPIGRLVVRAVRWSATASSIAVAVVAGAILLPRFAHHGLSEDVPDIAIWSIAWWGLLFVLLAGARLFATSRLFADRAFTVMGMLATFFGLAMLLVFFTQLGLEARAWFAMAPRLVEKHNRFLQDRVTNAEADMKKELADLDDEMRFEMSLLDDDADKKRLQERFETRIKPNRLRSLATTAGEYKIALDRGFRSDTTPFGLVRDFLANGPSDAPQDAGIFPALCGSLLVSAITLLFAVPIGVGAALYLEEYKSNSRLDRVIQININNLAGVPSVVYGILGGLFFVELIFKPLELRFDWIAARNALGGGMTLALLTLPVVIVSSQEAIRAVPSSIRHGAYALGATRWQTIWRQVLPLAWPGIMTGTILALSRAIGEAAPLVLFGALLFVDQAPGLLSRFTVLPMQIFGWADRPAASLDGATIEIWRANAAMACIVLLVSLLGLNAVAIVIRNRAQRKAKW